MTHRLGAMAEADIEVGRNPGKKRHYMGLTVLNAKGDRHFNGVVRTVPEALSIPLRWRKPRMIFVNSMSDLFHKDVPFEFIDRVFAVMALCPQHIFQVLTKRPERMAEYTFNANKLRQMAVLRAITSTQFKASKQHAEALHEAWRGDELPWPLPNVWLGASAEDQATFNARAHVLALVPAAVRFLSLEPLLGPINWSSHTVPIPWAGGESRGGRDYSPLMDFIHWVLIGGESGPGARPCNIDWIRSIVKQCRDAGTPCFVKQLGSVVHWDGVQGGYGDGPSNMWPEGTFWDDAGGIWRVHLKDRKGGDWSEWPDDLKVRQFPAQVLA